MTESTDATIPKEKVYKESAIWVGTFLGGPLAAGYFFSENFKALGEQQKVKPTWVVTIIAIIIIFGGIFLIPEHITIPNQIIPITYTALAFGIFKRFQEKSINEHVDKGGKIHSWGKIIGVAVVGLLVSLIPIFAFTYISDTIAQPDISTKTYGDVVKHEIDFDKTNIAEEEVDKIAEGFTETGFFDLSVPKYVFVSKSNDKYEIYLSVLEGTEEDAEAIIMFSALQQRMNDYLPTYEVEFNLVVDYLDNVVKVIK